MVKAVQQCSSIGGKVKDTVDVKFTRLDVSGVPISFWSSEELVVFDLYQNHTEVDPNSNEDIP